MTSVALGLFIIAIIYVAVWSIKNDGARSIRDQSGLIRMRSPADAPAGRRAKLGPLTSSASPSSSMDAEAGTSPAQQQQPRD